MVEIKRITHRLLLGKIGKTILPIKNWVYYFQFVCFKLHFFSIKNQHFFFSLLRYFDTLSNAWLEKSVSLLKRKYSGIQN
jgi:hypothetical protein